jgi:hypothetical protein
MERDRGGLTSTCSSATILPSSNCIERALDRREHDPMHGIQDQGKQQPEPITVPLVRPILSLLVGVVFFILPATVVIFVSMYWMFIVPEPNALTIWIDSATILEWLIAIVLIIYVIPTILLKLLHPLISRRIAYGWVTVDPTGLTLSTDQKKTVIHWDKPLQTRRWGARSTGGIDNFFNFYEVVELTQDGTQVLISRVIGYWKWRTLATPPDPMRGKFGYVVHPNALKAILDYARLHPPGSTGSRSHGHA